MCVQKNIAPTSTSTVWHVLRSGRVPRKKPHQLDHSGLPDCGETVVVDLNPYEPDRFNGPVRFRSINTVPYHGCFELHVLRIIDMSWNETHSVHFVHAPFRMAPATPACNFPEGSLRPGSHARVRWLQTVRRCVLAFRATKYSVRAGR